MGRKPTPVYKHYAAFLEDPTKHNFVDLIVAYAHNPGEETDKYCHQNVIAHLYWDAHFGALDANLGHFVWKMLRKHPVEAFKDREWVKSYFDWLTPQILPIVVGLEELLAC